MSSGYIPPDYDPRSCLDDFQASREVGLAITPENMIKLVQFLGLVWNEVQQLAQPIKIPYLCCSGWEDENSHSFQEFQTYSLFPFKIAVGEPIPQARQDRHLMLDKVTTRDSSNFVRPLGSIWSIGLG